MKDLLVACVVAGVAIGVSGLAFAGEAKSPKLLSDAQMEKVVAGAVGTYVLYNYGNAPETNVGLLDIPALGTCIIPYAGHANGFAGSGATSTIPCD